MGQLRIYKYKIDTTEIVVIYAFFLLVGSGLGMYLFTLYEKFYLVIMSFTIIPIFLTYIIVNKIKSSNKDYEHKYIEISPTQINLPKELVKTQTEIEKEKIELIEFKSPRNSIFEMALDETYNLTSVKIYYKENRVLTIKNKKVDLKKLYEKLIEEDYEELIEIKRSLYR